MRAARAARTQPMTNQLLIGNILSLLGQVSLVIASLNTSKTRTLVIQTVGFVLMCLANLALLGIAGFVMNVISIVRNILFAKDKAGKAVVAGLVLAYIVVTVAVEASVGFVDRFWYLPLLANIVFTVFAFVPSWKFKLMNTFTFACWIPYDLLLGNYVATAFDIGNVAANIVSIARIRRRET